MTGNSGPANLASAANLASWLRLVSIGPDGAVRGLLPRMVLVGPMPMVDRPAAVGWHTRHHVSTI